MDGTVTKKVELRGIGFCSTFKIFFAAALIFSLVSFILMNLFGMQLAGYLIQILTSIQQFIMGLKEKFPALFENEILRALMVSIVNGIILGLFFAIGSGIFTLFALLMGGLKIKIREKAPEKKTGYL